MYDENCNPIWITIFLKLVKNMLSKQNKFIEGLALASNFLFQVSYPAMRRAFGCVELFLTSVKFNSKLTYSGQDVEYMETGSFPKEDTNCFREIDTCKA